MYLVYFPDAFQNAMEGDGMVGMAHRVLSNPNSIHQVHSSLYYEKGRKIFMIYIYKLIDIRSKYLVHGSYLDELCTYIQNIYRGIVSVGLVCLVEKQTRLEIIFFELREHQKQGFWCREINSIHQKKTALVLALLVF
jgi:hypothetical protein